MAAYKFHALEGGDWTIQIDSAAILTGASTSQAVASVRGGKVCIETYFPYFRAVIDLAINTVEIGGVDVTASGAATIAEQLNTVVFFGPGIGGSGGGSTVLIEDVTFAQLETKIAGSQLVVGQQYEITDFETKHYIVDTAGMQYLDSIITGVNEALIVTAIAANKIDKEAKSALHPEDVIYYDWDANNWLEDLSFADLTTDSNNPVIVPGFKGVITFRHDTLLDNYMGYDFRNVKFRSWKMLSALSFDSTNTYYWASHPSQGIEGIGADASDFVDTKTFAEGSGTATYEKSCRGNHIEPFKDDYAFYEASGTLLNNNVFWLSDENYYTVYSNQIAAGSFGNRISKYFTRNTIGPYFDGNTIGPSFFGNRIAVKFFNNVVGEACRYNNVGAYFNGNTIGSPFLKNTVADDASQNVNYTAATHVYNNYNTTIFKRSDGVARLSYYDNFDAIQIVSPTA